MGRDSYCETKPLCHCTPKYPPVTQQRLGPGTSVLLRPVPALLLTLLCTLSKLQRDSMLPMDRRPVDPGCPMKIQAFAREWFRIQNGSILIGKLCKILYCENWSNNERPVCVYIYVYKYNCPKYVYMYLCILHMCIYIYIYIYIGQLILILYDLGLG